MTNALETMEGFFDRGFRAAKWEVSSGGGLMGCHEPFDLAGPVMAPLYRVVNRHHGTVALDVGDLTMHSHQPLSLLRIAEENPDIKLVVCHLLAPMEGHYRELELSLRLLEKENSTLPPCPRSWSRTATRIRRCMRCCAWPRISWVQIGCCGARTRPSRRRATHIPTCTTTCQKATPSRRTSCRRSITTTPKRSTSAEPGIARGRCRAKTHKTA